MYMCAAIVLPDFLVDEDEMMVGDEVIEKGLNKDLELQISAAIDKRFLLQLVRVSIQNNIFVGTL